MAASQTSEMSFHSKYAKNSSKLVPHAALAANKQICVVDFCSHSYCLDNEMDTKVPIRKAIWSDPYYHNSLERKNSLVIFILLFKDYPPISFLHIKHVYSLLLVEPLGPSLFSRFHFLLKKNSFTFSIPNLSAPLLLCSSNLLLFFQVHITALLCLPPCSTFFTYSIHALSWTPTRLHTFTHIPRLL